MSFSWTLGTAPNTTVHANIAWSAELGLFCRTSGSGGVGTSRVQTSPDGVTWTQRSVPSDIACAGVCWAGGTIQKFVIALTSSVSAFYSSDGINWSTATVDTNARSWQTVAYSSTLDRLVMVATNGTTTSGLLAEKVRYSNDGITWNTGVESGSNIDGKSWRHVCWAGGTIAKFIILNTNSGDAGGSNFNAAWSSDGINWTLFFLNSGDAHAFGGATTSLDITYSSTLDMVAAHTSTVDTNSFWTSTNGTSWTQRTADAPPGGFPWRGMVSTPQGFVCVARGTTGTIISSFDGVTWTTSDTGLVTKQWINIAYSSSLNLLVACSSDISTANVMSGAQASLSPTTGNPVGGETITIVGTGVNGGFLAAADGLKVGFDLDANLVLTNGGAISTSVAVPFHITDVLATEVEVTSATTLTCTTPHGKSVRSVLVWDDDITDATPNVLAYFQDGFTFGTPTISTISPTFGSIYGGTRVTITGTNLFETQTSGPGTVTFGSTAALDVVQADPFDYTHSNRRSTSLTCVAPAHIAGQVNVTYSPPSLDIGGANVTFADTIISTGAPSPDSPDPAGTGGFSYKTLTTRRYARYLNGVVDTSPETDLDGDGLVDDGLGNWAEALVTAPAVGCGVGGDTIALMGAGFTGATTVTIGGSAATAITIVSPEVLTCVTPAHADGLVDVVTANPSLTGTNGFEYGTPWWIRTDTLIVNDPDVGSIEYNFDEYVQSCSSPTNGEWSIDLDPLGTKSFRWLRLGDDEWYVYQIRRPGYRWAPGTPVSNNGWYYSIAAYGGSVVTVDTGTPGNPRTWSDIAVWAAANTGMLGGSPAASCTINNRMIYPATGYTVGTHYPPLRIFDGAFDHELCRLPPTTTNGVPQAVLSMLAANGTVYLTSFDSGTTSANWAGRVLQLDYISGEITPLGAAFTAGEMPYALAWHLGRLWVGTNNGIGTVGKVYYFRPGIDTAWTLDHSLATETLGGVDSMLEYQGKLYVGSDNVALSRGKILVRDTSGAYTVSDTGSGGTAVVNNGFLSMATFGTNLYAAYWNNDATAVAYIRKFDGSAWSTVYTGASTTLRPYILLFQDNGTLYAMGGGKLLAAAVLTSTTGTSWTDQTAHLPESNKTLLPVYGVEIL